MSIHDIRQARIQKLAKLKEHKINAYPIKNERSFRCGGVILNSEKLIEEKTKLSLAGRIRSLRAHGGSMFLHLEDESGKLQLFFKKDLLGDEAFKLFQDTIDVGDFIEVEGELFTTRTKELTLRAEEWKMLAKSLRPLPDKWYGLKDKETKIRKPYLNLLSDPVFKERIKLRVKLISALREFLNQEGFIEVETPILQKQAGGALARPFKTKLNALDIELYLRIAPELYLKRLIIGGFEKVYEIGKCFRNEGIDFAHNPEFTMLEFYWAYSDYEKLMVFTEKLMREVLKIFPKNESKIHQFFEKPLSRLEYGTLFKKVTGFDWRKIDKQALKDLLKKEGIKKSDEEGDRWMLLDEVFKKICLKKTDEPFFLIHHPLALSPLAKKLEGSEELVARFQLIIQGAEIINAYSEINDPLDQEARFEIQQKRLYEGQREVHPYDKDFIEALEYGMPPTAGWGMGIDRLVTVLTGSQNLKEVILFPLMRPKRNIKDKK